MQSRSLAHLPIDTLRPFMAHFEGP